MLKYFLSLFLTIMPFQIQSAFKGYPDIRGMQARERLQEKMKSRANLQTTEGKELVERINQRQQESLQGAYAFADKAIAESQRKNKKEVGTLPTQSVEAKGDREFMQKIAKALKGKVTKNKKDLLSALNQASTPQ